MSQQIMSKEELDKLPIEQQIIELQINYSAVWNKDSTKNNPTGPCQAIQNMLETDQELFEKMMPLWYKRMTEAQTWTELQEPKKMKGKDGIEHELNGTWRGDMIAEFHNFSTDSITQGMKGYDKVMESYAGVLGCLFGTCKDLETQKKSRTRDNTLLYLGTTFGWTMSGCIGYIQRKYPEQYVSETQVSWIV